jgi:hypothetical protein
MYVAPITKLVCYRPLFPLLILVCLRVSEISLKTRSDESGHALKFNNVSFENNDKTLCVKISSSKTDMFIKKLTSSFKLSKAGVGFDRAFCLLLDTKS